jgi:UDP-N-acetylmuramoyl-tripeptide--D-alanyl-D-alanine ligase
MLNLADVFEALTHTRPTNVNQVISEGCIDSRMAIPGSLFVAMPGEKVNGHEYISDAFKHGSSVALVQEDVSASYPVIDLRSGVLPAGLTLPDAPFCIRLDNSLSGLQTIAKFWRAQLNLRVIGITGSVGKSTTKELVSEVLCMRYRTLRNPGNLNNEIGLPLTVLRLGPGYERAVLEMGFYVPGEIAFLCEIAKPQVGVVTNIGTVHAERAGSQEVIARGKAELIRSLPAAPTGTAILNYDDPWVRDMASLTAANVIFYGLDPKADLWADQIISDGLEGIQFQLHYHTDSMQLRVPLIGQHSVHTALRAAAVGLAEDMTWPEIVTGLRYSHTQLRLVAVHTPNGALLLDDTYNASPESTLAALNLLADLTGRKVAVLGDMLELGQYEQQGHEKVGVRAAEVADEVVALGERSQMITDAALNSGMESEKVHHFSKIEDVIEYLKTTLKNGDVALIKGSHGLRMDRIVSALEADE